MLFKDDHFEDSINHNSYNNIICEDTMSTLDIDQMSDANDSIISMTEMKSQANKDAEWESPTLFDHRDDSIKNDSFSECNTPCRKLTEKCVSSNTLEENGKSEAIPDNKLDNNNIKDVSVVETYSCENENGSGCNSNNTLNRIVNEPINGKFEDKIACGEIPDIYELYKYVNEIYQDTLSNKRNYESLMQKIFDLTNRVDTMTGQFNEFKSSIYGNVLGFEIQLENMEKQKKPNLTAVHNKIEVNKSRINNIVNFENACKRYDHYIDVTNKKLSGYKEELKKSKQHRKIRTLVKMRANN